MPRASFGNYWIWQVLTWKKCGNCTADLTAVWFDFLLDSSSEPVGQLLDNPSIPRCVADKIAILAYKSDHTSCSDSNYGVLNYLCIMKSIFPICHSFYLMFNIMNLFYFFIWQFVKLHCDETNGKIESGCPGSNFKPASLSRIACMITKMGRNTRKMLSKICILVNRWHFS